jgi:pyridoxine 5-phosphate synthase
LKEAVPLLGVNVDHVATVRQARRTYEPDPATAAALATLAGADIITIHLREDRRHIQDRDVRLMKQTVFSKLNLEMGAAEEIVKIAEEVQPDQVTLVPEKREEVTTEGGLDVVGGRRRIGDVVRRLHDRGIIVSLFIDPDSEQIKAAAGVRASYVELHTGPYANAAPGRKRAAELKLLVEGAEEAKRAGLGVNAGHGLTYTNLTPLLEKIRPIELHIGHSIISRAVLVGIDRAVREMKELIYRAYD